MSAATLSLVILATTVVLFVWNRLPVEVVALGCALTLLFTGLVDSGTVFSGFGDPVIVFIAALFVVSEGLESSGVTAWISGMLSRVGGTTHTRILITVMGLAAVVAAVITVNGAAAALLPVTVAVARSATIQTVPGPGAARVRVQRGRDAHVDRQPGERDHPGASVQAGGGGFGYLEFALIGVPLVLATMLVCALLGARLLPDRTPTRAPTDFTDYLPSLVEHWAADYRVWRLTVHADGPALGDTFGRADRGRGSDPGRHPDRIGSGHRFQPPSGGRRPPRGQWRGIGRHGLR